MKYFAETEKAVKVRAKCETYAETAYSTFMWIPKSMLEEGKPSAKALQMKSKEIANGFVYAFYDAEGNDITILPPFKQKKASKKALKQWNF